MRVTSLAPFDQAEPGPRVSLLSALVPAGFPSPADDYAQASLDISELVVRNPAATFFARAAGSSMEPKIHEGDVLVVDRSVRATSGRIVVALLDGEMTVKRLKRQGSRWLLVPENPAFPIIPVEDGVECTVWGVVTFVVHEAK